MRRLIWLPIAGFLLIAGAAIAVAAAAPSVVPTQGNFDASSPVPGASSAPNSNGGPAGGFFGHMFASGPGADLLNQVLSDLVKAGTISQAQSDAITSALQKAVTDKQAQLQQQRQELMQEWTQIQGFLKEGVITQDEVNQLPADSPFRQAFNSIAQNGQITTQQLMQLMQTFGFGGPGMHGWFGPGPAMRGPWGPGGPWKNGGGPAPQGSPAPQVSPGTSTTGTNS